MGIFLLHILSLKYVENYSQGHLIEIDTAAATMPFLLWLFWIMETVRPQTGTD